MTISLIAYALRDKISQESLGFKEAIENYGLSVKLSEDCFAVDRSRA